MADGKVLFELELRQKGDKVQIVQKQTEKLANSTEKLDKKRKKLTKTTDAYNRREKGAAQISSNSTKNFSKMAQGIDGGGGSGGLVRAYALLAANVFALSAAFGILSRSAQIDTLVESMQRLEVVSGKSIRGVARDLQEASGFGLDFAESMRAVSLATSAGFGGDKIVELGNVARNAAVSLGRNLPDALDRIFRGVIKVEPELLDEIGLFVRVNDASAKYAATLKKSVGDLTEFEKRQAFLNEALEQGGSKFEAFQDVENDAFALLATTFADISHAAISFVNKGITPIVRMLAENKVLFSTVFAALGIALLKLAVPAMAAFTQSLAINAVQQAKNAADAKKDAELRAGMAKKENLEFLAQQKKKQEELAKTAMAQTQAGPQGKLSVRGKKQSAGLETALSKELNVKTRMQLVDQRIADIENNRGKTQRLKNKNVQIELAALKEERRIHAEITSLESQQAAARQADVASGKGSVVRMTQERAYAASLRATSLATVANQAQSLGLAAAYRQIGVELNKTNAATAFGTGVFGAFRKTLFVTKAAAVSTGIAFQGMWMKIMGPFSVFLLLLPLFMKFNKMLGVGSEEAEKLTKANKSAAEALDLLPRRLEHVSEQLAKSDTDIVSVNKGMETFKNTILTTITAIQAQEEAFDTYLESATRWAKFWGETFPSIFGGGTANAIEENKEDLIKGLRENDKIISKEMQGLLDTLTMLETTEKKVGPMQVGVRVATDEEIKTQTDLIIKRAEEETKAYTNMRSAISGARDTAREFTNSMITKTQADGPLSSFRQLEKTISSTFLTEKERSDQLKEISQDAAILAMMTEDERKSLKDTTKTEEDRLAVITTVKDRYFEQQESIIQSKTELKEIQQIQKAINGLLKESTGAIEQNFKLEQRRREIQAEQVGFNKTNALSQSNLTEERIRELMAVKDIRTALTDKEKQLTDIKSVQSAITAITEEDIQLFKNRIQVATETERKEKMIAEAKLAGLKRTEKTNKLEAERAQIAADIAAFEGGTSGGRAEKLMKAIAAEVSAQKTRADILEQEKEIAKLNLDILAAEATQMAIEVGLETERGKQYTASAKVLTAAGLQVAKDIQTGANNAAKALGLSLVNVFAGAGASSGAQTDLISSITALQDFANSDENIIDGQAIVTESMMATAAINAMEEALMNFGNTASELFGEDGAVISAMAQFSASILNMGQAIETFNARTVDNTAQAVAALAEGVAGAIGGLMSVLNAKNQQAVKGVDNLIEAEKRRDGKSKESLAKIAVMEKKKENMQKKAFEINKKLMIAQAIASTAAGVAGALAIKSPYEFPLAAVVAGLIGALGAAQIAIISGLTYQSNSAPAQKSVPSNIEVGKRNTSVDTSRGATGGELAFLRGQQGVGSNANNFTPGGAAGMKRGYASGGEILVGERGPEIVQPTTEGFNVVPNDKIGGTTNVNFSINAVDAAGVEDLLTAQRGNIIGMIREAANEHGQEFMEEVNTGAY